MDGRRFRRQQVIGNYIVDFYCPSERLIIELDGVPHSKPAAKVYDNNRDLCLANAGNKILRFKNGIVFENMQSVLNTIQENFGWKVES